MAAEDTVRVSFPPKLQAVLEAHCGTLRLIRALPQLTPTGLAVRGYVVEGATGRWVIKRMGYERDAASLALLLETVRAAGIRCPHLAQAIPLEDEWLALFTFEVGESVGLTDPRWLAMWERALIILEQLHHIPSPPAPWRLEALWQVRLDTVPFEGAAQELWAYLRYSPPPGAHTLAHGDFAPQNFLWTEAGVLVLDWEEAGWAAPAFDAGWLLALNRVGAGPRLAQAALMDDLIARGFPIANLRWFEGLGLLRMLYRRWVPRGVPIPTHEQQLSAALTQLLQLKIADYLTERSVL